MLRFAVACAAVELASQTAQGSGFVHSSAVATPIPMKLELAADFETFSFVEAVTSHFTMSTSGVNVSSDTSTTFLMSVNMKDPGPSRVATLYSHMRTSTEVAPQPAKVTEFCKKFVITNLRPVGDIHTCVQGVAAAFKPDWTAGGLDAYSMNQTVAGAQNNATLFLDQAHLLRALGDDQVVPPQGGAPGLSTQFHIDLTSTAGRPDPARFAVDPAWTCTDAPVPPPPPGVAKAIFECLEQPAQWAPAAGRAWAASNVVV